MIRDYILLYVNGQRTEVRGNDVFLPLSSFLRYRLCKTGTKIVCSEGDCGACSVMAAFPNQQQATKSSPFRVMNSCIAPLYLLDGASVVSVEGLKKSNELSEVQKKMVGSYGSQCGFCTPGFVMALTNMCESSKTINEKKIRNYTTGNLCRCTGYDPIIKAGLSIDLKKIEPLASRYLIKSIQDDLKKTTRSGFLVETSEKRVFGPRSSKEVSSILKKHSKIRIVSFATDLGVQYNKEKIELEEVMTLHLVQDLFDIKESMHKIKIGAKVDLATIQLDLEKKIPEFSRFLNIFASPQIRNVASLVGNIANASPIGDTLPFLFVAEAEIELQSTKGKRIVSIINFYKGYKTLDIKRGEWISAVQIPIPKPSKKIFLYKVSQRRDLDISKVIAAFLVERRDGLIKDIRIAYGGVGPTTLRLKKTESFLKNKPVNENSMAMARQLLQKEISPISDLRASSEFRRKVSDNLLRKFFMEAAQA